MILGFKDRFRALILDGLKIHTIREDKSNRWKKGMMIHAATGVRTKNYRQFANLQCMSVQRIIIDTSAHYSNGYYTEVDGRRLTLDETRELAINDGFTSIADFYQWFYFFYDEHFTGKIIHWTDKRY